MRDNHAKKRGGKGARRRARRRSGRRAQPINLGLHSGPLRIVAFSDYRAQDIQVLIAELSKLQPPPDLILYAGDDIGRFQSASGENLFEVIASRSRHGLCAVPGNDDEPSVRELIRGKSVFNVHLCPAVIGDYAVLGIEGAPYRRDLEKRGYISHSEQEIRKQLTAQEHKVKSKRLIILSHAPPEGVLDQSVRFSPDGRPRSIGSRALKKFLQSSNNVPLVVCGHAHRCGGKHKKVGRTLVVNAANHDDCKAVARHAVIDLAPTGGPRLQWRFIRETSVVPGIASASAERLRKVGIRTVEELAAAPRELIRRVPHLGHNPEVLRARARAIVENRPILLRPLELPPGPELFLDIETDLGQKYIWLIGVCVGRDGSYDAFFAEKPEYEKDILQDFLDYVSRYPTASILTLSGCTFEQRVMRSRLAAHGFDTSVCARIVDLYWIIQPSVAVPTGSYRVKEIGGFFGYHYKHPDLNGFTVASLYENRYQSLGKTPAGQNLARKLVEYNKDDVRCLPHILKAIQALPSQSVPE